MKKYITCLFVLAALTGNVRGQLDLSDLFWVTCNASGLLDTKNEQFIAGFDANVSYLFFLNGGVGYKNVHAVDAAKLSVYAGIGFGSFVQLQAGFPVGNRSMIRNGGKNGFSIRNRYDWPVGYWGDIGGILGNITLSPMIERHMNRPDMKWYIGIGIGYSINYASGIRHPFGSF